MASTPGFEPRRHWWEASALTTATPLLPSKMLKRLSRQLNSKNNTIFRHWNCSMSSFARDGKGEHGWKLDKVKPAFKVLMPCLQKPLKKKIMINAPWWNLFDIFFYTEFTYHSSDQTKTCIIRLTSTHLIVTMRLLLKQISIRDF